MTVKTKNLANLQIENKGVAGDEAKVKFIGVLAR
jgi:hypothetical protein